MNTLCTIKVLLVTLDFESRVGRKKENGKEGEKEGERTEEEQEVRSE